MTLFFMIASKLRQTRTQQSRYATDNMCFQFGLFCICEMCRN